MNCNLLDKEVVASGEQFIKNIKNGIIRKRKLSNMFDNNLSNQKEKSKNKG